ncbi:DUF992 domain-containing protein [Chelativorans sp. YIM 93263]|uniref:DUF992 domain-containing protein n=1 Tax=Chelativorans sp. YIM 93263 TaxID=2906648 RepID=UPI002378B955|nr:DUF992 domain-containing protein [Chelativorans sp. YIM 93263]
MNKGVMFALGTLFASVTYAGPLAAEERTEIGVLDCIIEGGMDIAIVTSKELSCTFQPAGNTRPPETYVGVVNNFGLDIGATSEKVMRWLVLAPTTTNAYEPGSLADDYVGASAEVTAGIGGGANVLVSGTNKNLILQPVSLQAQTGLNLAVGVSEFQLRSAEM